MFLTVLFDLKCINNFHLRIWLIRLRYEQAGGQEIKCNGIWVHERFRKRKVEGEFATLHRELEDEEMRYLDISECQSTNLPFY